MGVAEGTQIEVAPAQRHIIRRPRLERLLDETSARVILLVAPAGYGKTTLARQWLEDKPHAWYQATPASADVAALATGLTAVLQIANATARDRLADLLRASADPRDTAEGIVRVLVGAMVDSAEQAILMIDDYHYLVGSDVAEYVIEQLIEQTSLRLIVTSRSRPSWATPRRILYGEFHEVTRGILAFSSDEAVAVLAHERSEEVDGLLALAEGWPAVIGLAALSRVWLGVPSDLPDALHEYFAEELFQGLSPQVARALCQLSTAPRITHEFLEYLFGRDASAISQAGVASGFLTPRSPSAYDLHPLLRAFLERKLREHGIEATRNAAASTAQFLLGQRQWDDAFSVIDQFEQGDLLGDLIADAMDELLALGRLTTLDRWAAAAKAADVPIALVVEAELSFRRGEYFRVEACAVDALGRLETGDRFVSRAWTRAGQAAYFRDDFELALDRLRQARETAVSLKDLAAALAASFNASIEAETEDARDYLAILASLPTHQRDDPLRVELSKLFLANRFDGVRAITRTLSGVMKLLPDTPDPLVRSSFLNSAAYALTLAGQYNRAVELTDLEISEARNSNLSFVVAHARMNRANALIGLRRFTEAEQELTYVESLSSEDLYVRINSSAIAVRFAIARGRQASVLGQLDEELALRCSKGMHGEYLALFAVAYASCGKEAEANRLSQQALRVTRTIEPRVLSAGAQAICALMSNSRQLDLRLDELAALMASTGIVDSVVCAYRAYPPLLRALLRRNPRTHDTLMGVIREAGDLPLLMPHNTARRGETGVGGLSKREREVLALLAEGMTNREIATKLYISEVTAKVHVRHILAKLGVRTRTEAAVVAVREPH